jgi:hypothetical protein
MQETHTILPPDFWFMMFEFIVMNPEDGPCGSPVPRVSMIAGKINIIDFQTSVAKW